MVKLLLSRYTFESLKAKQSILQEDRGLISDQVGRKWIMVLHFSEGSVETHTKLLVFRL